MGRLAQEPPEPREMRKHSKRRQGATLSRRWRPRPGIADFPKWCPVEPERHLPAPSRATLLCAHGGLGILSRTPTSREANQRCADR